MCACLPFNSAEWCWSEEWHQGLSLALFLLPLWSSVQLQGLWKGWRRWHLSRSLHQKLSKWPRHSVRGKYMMLCFFSGSGKKVPQMRWRQMWPLLYCGEGVVWRMSVVYNVWLLCDFHLLSPLSGITQEAAGCLDMPIAWNILGTSVQVYRGEWRNKMEII